MIVLLGLFLSYRRIFSPSVRAGNGSIPYAMRKDIKSLRKGSKTQSNKIFINGRRTPPVCRRFRTDCTAGTWAFSRGEVDFAKGLTAVYTPDLRPAKLLTNCKHSEILQNSRALLRLTEYNGKSRQNRGDAPRFSPISRRNRFFSPFLTLYIFPKMCYPIYGFGKYQF